MKGICFKEDLYRATVSGRLKLAGPCIVEIVFRRWWAVIKILFAKWAFYFVAIKRGKYVNYYYEGTALIGYDFVDRKD